MVGPPSAAEQAANRKRVAFWLVGVVALSTGLSAAYGGADLLTVILIAGAGAIVGAALVVAIGALP